MDAGESVLPQRLLAPELTAVFLVLLDTVLGAGPMGFVNLVLKMLHKCLCAGEIPLAVIAPELTGVYDRLEILCESGSVGEELLAVAAITVAIVLFKLARSLAAAGTFLCLRGR